MQQETLKYINDKLDAAGIPYQFGMFASDISSLNYYFVGEYTEIEPMNEDGLVESQFMLTGTGKGFSELENAKDTIRSLFPEIEGDVAILDNGSAVAIFYASAMYIPTVDDRLKRMQIDLKIKEWKV